MAVCPTCLREVDDAAAAASGRCPSCGAALRPLAQRTIADIRTRKPTDADELQRSDMTIDLPPGGLGGSIDLELVESKATVPELPPVPADGDAGEGESLSSSKTISEPQPPVAPQPRHVGVKQPTVAFGAEKTIEFTGTGSGAIDESMLTSQWDGAFPQGTGAGATIKQKETISGTYVSSSSLIVKSRHVTPPGPTPALRPMSPADAPDYELLNVIGEGGMGVVYAARQSSIARTVALKMLKSGDADVAQRDKFISEAVVTGELDHPNIVPIYDLGANDDGALFYSMKRVKGTPWHKVIREKSLDENLNILLRVADAVAFAHVNGVVHRDLKPENVMLGDFGEVLVMDWGLARVTAEFPNVASVTQSDAMGGTPAYMAPEMATGPLDRITPASDVYLLGAILYEIITGRPPHTGKTVMACLFAAAKNQIAPSDKTGELVDIALKAMATKPENRYASVQKFQNAVRAYQAHAESLRLLNIAGKHLDEGAKKLDYELYARAIYALEESLSLWPGNEKANILLGGAKVDYARLALSKGDYDLGASLLNPDEDSHKAVLADLEAGRRERESRQRRIKLLKGTVGALAAAVIAIVSIAFFAVRAQRDEADRLRVVAETNRVEAEEQRDQAEASRKEAVAAKLLADQNAEEARLAQVAEAKQRERAEAGELAANVAKEAAIESEKEAVLAREAEEYSAYVARIGLTKAKLDENAFDTAVALLEECPPDLRNWEWGRLLYTTRMADRTLPAAAPIDSAAFAPDGEHFATGGWDGKATLWNLATGAPDAELPQGQHVRAVAYDAAGERIALGSNDGEVAIYRVADKQPIARLVGHKGGVLSIRFSPDGRQLLTAGEDETARIWDIAAEKELQKPLHGHSWWVWSAEFSPDGGRIVTAGQDGQVVLWNRQARPGPNGFREYVESFHFTEHVGAVYAARFSPDGREVASAGNDGRVLLWDPAGLKPLELQSLIDDATATREQAAAAQTPMTPYRALAGHRGPVRTLCYSPDGSSLVSGGEDNTIFVWDPVAGTELAQLRGHASHVTSCAFSPDGQWLLSASRDKTIKLWQPQKQGETKRLAARDEEGTGVLSARFSADGREVITANRDRTASLWDARDMKRRQWFQEGHQFLASSAAFYADGSRVATAAGDGTVRVWDVATGKELFRLQGTGYTAVVAVSDDGRFIATAAVSHDVQIWDATTGGLSATLPGHNSVVSAVRFAPGGKLLATGDENGHCRLWKLDPAANAWRAAARPLDGHSRSIAALAFADGGARLISASSDNTCAQWDVAALRELDGLILKHPDYVIDMAVTRDGQLALTACGDGQLRLWSLPAARVIGTLNAQAPTKVEYTSVDISPDGRYAAAASNDQGQVRVWDLGTGAELTSSATRAAGDELFAAAPADADRPGEPPAAWLDLGAETNAIFAARFAPDGAHLLTIGGNDAQLRTIDTRQAAVRYSPHGIVASADVSPDGTRVVTGSFDRSAKIWDAATGRVVVKLADAHAAAINSVCYSPDGTTILTASDDGTARLWNAADGQPLAIVLRGHRGAVNQACFSPDGTQILTAGADHTARLWDARTGEQVRELTGHDWGVLSVAFSANGKRIITGSVDNLARVWDAATGDEITILKGHTAGVTAVALSPDGSRALTGSQDCAAKLWDAKTGKEILTLAGHTSEVTATAFSPDGLTALTSGRDNRVLLWPAVDWSSPAERQARR
jgi:WD40 repeat protein/serine/threonine protein kinase